MTRPALVQTLLAVRQGAPLLETVPDAQRPADVADAYRVAEHIVDVLIAEAGEVAGFKIGATSAGGQKFLGLSSPFYGRLPAGRISMSGVQWPAAPHPVSVEAEVGFVVGSALPPRDLPYSKVEVTAALSAAVPLLEINSPSFAKPFEVGGLCLIADNGVTHALVTGALPVDTMAASYAGEAVHLMRNGEPVASGDASVVLGDPVNAVCWLANALRGGSRGLRVGDVIASGALTAPIPASPGDEFEAHYTTLGRVTARMAR